MSTNQSSAVSNIKPVRRQEHTSSRRRSGSSHHYKSRVKRYKLLLATTSIVLSIALIFSWLHISRQSHDHNQTVLDLRKQKVVSEDLAKEIETVKNERDVLVQNRIPGLMPLTYDEAINIDNDFVRNIIFTLAKTGKKDIYEYRLVLHNNTLSVVRPKAEIIMFNSVGIQIGMTQIEQTDATTETAARASLDPGEVRSYTAAIDLIRDEEPSYFLLIISEANHTATDELRKQLNGIISAD